jgi:hypothetical protein
MTMKKFTPSAGRCTVLDLVIIHLMTSNIVYSELAIVTDSYDSYGFSVPNLISVIEDIFIEDIFIPDL